MGFGIKKCCVLILKNGKTISKSHGIKLERGETVNGVGEEGYKYLGIIGRDQTNEQKMKEMFRKKYLRIWQ